MVKMKTTKISGKVFDGDERSDGESAKSSWCCIESASIEPDLAPSSLAQQPPRPAPWIRQFLPLEDDDDQRTTLEKTEVKLSLLCSKCQPIQTFLQSSISDSVEWNATRNGIPYVIFPTLSPLLPNSFPHYESGRLLEASSKRGCHLCTLIWESLVWPLDHTQGRTGAQRDGDEFAAFEQAAVDCRSRCAVSVRLRNAQPTRDIFMFEMYDAFAVLEAEIVTPFPLERLKMNGKSVRGRDIILSYTEYPTPNDTSPVTTKSGDSMDLVKGWLSSCLHSHPECINSSAKSVPLPTRLLRISRSSDGCELVKLVETQDLDRSKLDMRYTVLSYCWGGKAAVELSMANRDSMRTEGIPTSQLSRTIRDAIWLTKTLGLAWIWVDSLCIIQDYPTDWEWESLLMCSVYNGCYLSIAARGAKTAADGLFARRDPLRYAHCLLAKGISEPGRCILACPVYRTGYKGYLAKWPLEQRGWAVQERLLPPRTVSFGPYLAWNCNKLDISEFGVEHVNRYQRGGSSDLLEESISRNFSRMVIRPECPLSAVRTGTDTITVTTDAKLYQFWTLIVIQYSQAQLSVKSDRHAALSGVMSAFEQRTGWSQVGGPWDRDPFLLLGLLWRIRVYTSNAQRTGLGPSWSWVSVDCAIMYEEKSLDVNALPLASATASSPKSITLKRAVVLEAEFSQESWFSKQEGSRIMDFTICGWPDDLIQKWKAQSDQLSRGKLMATFDVQVPNPGQRGLLVPLYMDYIHVLGLVVQKRGERSFERLGLWEMGFRGIDAELGQDVTAHCLRVQRLVLDAVERDGRDIILV